MFAHILNINNRSDEAEKYATEGLSYQSILDYL